MNDFNLFQSNVHWKIMRYLCLFGNRDDLNLSDIARKIDASKGMVSIALRDLHNSGLVRRRNVSNSQIYSLAEGPLIDQLKRTIGLSLILDSGIIRRIREKDPDLITMVLYGSFARGNFDDLSDIDIILISSSGSSGRIGSIDPIEEFQVNVNTFTVASWNSLKVKNDPFYSRVMEDHITLYGSGLV